jgi:hypothetical protein
VNFRSLDAGPVITSYWALDKHAISWIALSSDRPLEVHLWVTFVQSDAKTQPVFRSYRV